jgi:hypothetical protein
MEDDLIFDTLAVLIRTKNGKIYQAALTEEMSSALYTDLKNLYFDDGVVKIMPTELQGIEFSENPNYKPKDSPCTKT